MWCDFFRPRWTSLLWSPWKLPFLGVEIKILNPPSRHEERPKRPKRSPTVYRPEPANATRGTKKFKKTWQISEKPLRSRALS